MSYFDFEGHKIFYEETGSGEALLLLHGNTVSGDFFSPVIPLLSEKYHVIVPDLLGCGRSEHIRDWPADLWYEWAGQAAALIRHLGLEKVDLIGCSGGALAAINLALEAPELVNSVIADSFEGTRADPGLTDQIRAGRAYAKQNEGFCSFLRSLHGEDWESVLDADTDAVVRHAEQVTDFFHRPLGSLSVDLLLTGSDEDEMFPAGHCRRLFDEVCRETAHAKAHIFPHGSHPAMMSNMNEFISLSEEFFSAG